MKDGTYHYAIQMQAPIGPRRGALELVLKNHMVSGALTMFSQTHPIFDASLNDGLLRFAGQMQTLRYFLPYQAEGTADSRQVNLLFRTEKGCFHATGTVDPEGGTLYE